MGKFEQNVQIACIYCGKQNILGRETSFKDRWGNTITECRWVCDRCGMLVRCDENKILKPQKEEKKETNVENKTK